MRNFSWKSDPLTSFYPINKVLKYHHFANLYIFENKARRKIHGPKVTGKVVLVLN